MTTQEYEPRYDAQNRRLCYAKNNTCRGPAMTGQKVCKAHGGSSPQAKRSARLRLAGLVDPAIATLAKEMTGAEKSNDRLAAANSVLDRAGYGRAQQIETTDAREILLEKLLELQTENNEPEQDETE